MFIVFVLTYLEKLPLHGDKGFRQRVFDEVPVTVGKHGKRRERLVSVISATRLARWRCNFGFVEWRKIEGHCNRRSGSIGVIVVAVKVMVQQVFSKFGAEVYQPFEHMATLHKVAVFEALVETGNVS